LYEAREEALFDRNSLLSDAREEGITKGKAEGKADIIRAMLQKGLTVSRITEFTGLTVEEVKLIKF
jgi:predicted transposase/invertase (TIGR01784 family)